MRTSIRILTGMTVIATALGAGALLPANASAASDRTRPAGHERVQALLDRAVSTGAPGADALIQNGHQLWFGSAGVSDTATGRRRRPDERFRIGSTTKAFTATLVLQLVADHVLRLDDTVDRWLPGLVQGNGNDGRKITIRELLNHTSGLFAYTNDEAFFPQGVGAAWFQHRYDHHSPEELVRIALRHPPYGPPGQLFTYSNTDYILAAMIVERATGHSFGTEIDRRILRPLRLTGTSLPGDQVTVPGPHPVHYSILFSQDPHPAIQDATDMNQSFAWTAGGMISTAVDLTRFFGALLGGHLLPAGQQRELFSTVPTDGRGWIEHTRYGLGIFS